MNPEAFDLEGVTLCLAGAVTPFLVQFIRSRKKTWNGPSAFMLSLLITWGLALIGYYQLDSTPTFPEAIKAQSMVFTVSQMLYRSIETQLKGEAPSD